MIDVRDFIQQNYTPYYGDSDFLKGPTTRTLELWSKVKKLLERESKEGGVLDIDTSRASTITSHNAGYIDKDLELIVGLQTDKPLKRGINPFGGLRMVQKSCEAYNKEFPTDVKNQFKYRLTHNDSVFRLYTSEIKKLRHAGILTGLPDAYGRGRIIGDYRRVALYGVDALIQDRLEYKDLLSKNILNQDTLTQLEELCDQIQALTDLKEMAKSYGYDISMPAINAREAIQWTYFAYLGAIKEQNGAAMSLGRVSTFLDIYIERDLKKGILTEEEAQELMDDFIIKLRLSRQLRTPEYDELFGGDPTWTTESVGGMGIDSRTLVTKNSFRILQSLYNLGPAPEPNLTILWSNSLPKYFKKFVAKVSIDTNSIQYENDDVMRPDFGDDYGIACCVSAMKIGKQMQYFGARCNLPKLLLLALNGGKDEKTGEQIGPVGKQFSGKLVYEDVLEAFYFYMDWLCKEYINALNIIHYSHDKYCYEKLQMSLHDPVVERFMACGIAGLSVVADSLSAIKSNVVTANVLSDKIDNFILDGDYPKFGNDIDSVDNIAIDVVEKFNSTLKRYQPYRNAKTTLSLLTITSNVVYGKKTGATPDGRKAGEPFAPGANPMHNREYDGPLASLNSVAKLPYACCKDGISNTFSITPNTLGSIGRDQIANLVDILDGYFTQGAHHLNVNVLNREKLIEAMEDPNKYPNITIRVSGYAVNFHRLSKEQQKEVILRTFH